MFLSKEKRKEDDIEVVKCEDCNSLVAVYDAQEITNYLGYGTRTEVYYCKTHRKPYDRIRYGEYFGEIRMNPDGTPIGYIKKPKDTPPEVENTNGLK